jgi:hypothetical protein
MQLICCLRKTIISLDHLTNPENNYYYRMTYFDINSDFLERFPSEGQLVTRALIWCMEHGDAIG